MQTSAAEKRQKAKILRWRGVLAESTRMLRWMVAVVLAVAGAALTFLQLGFVDLTTPDGATGYLVALLQVVALGALLLGTLPGVALGLVTGGALLLHAQLLPLDHYELTFVTPLTSIVMFGVSGLLLGVLFAFVLRNNPKQVKRIIYIIIVCGIVSMLYSIGFVFNVFISLIVEIAQDVGADVNETYAQRMAAETTMQLGNIGLQAHSTGFLMTVLCVIGDYVARRAQEYKGSLGLRSVFSIWLAVVVALAFMTMSAVSFAVATNDELRDAEEAMESEVLYLCNQITMTYERANLIGSIVKQGELDVDKVDEASLAELSDLLEGRLLLDGYMTENDGVVIITIGDAIYASDDDSFTPGLDINDIFNSSAIEAIKYSEETGEMQRIVFDSAKISSSGPADAASANAQPHIAYLCARTVSDPFSNASGPIETLDSDQGYTQSVILMKSSDQVFAKRTSVMAWMTLSEFVLLLGVFFIVFQLLNRVVAQRIDEENKTLALITAGELDTRAEAGGTREFESLSSGINTTVDALKGWIAEAETRMDAELATAKAIQESALPRIFPPFPDIPKFDVYASMNAAREVGGDFYDFFLMGDCTPYAGKLAFMVADVSGKGVPAALFMMKAKTQIRDYLESGMELGEAVENANQQLIDGNDAGMFVTAWIGVLDYATGRVDFVNAGHNPPLLWQREGGWRWLREKSGPVLGLFDMPYCAYSVDCHPGDTFLTYTDGVTEAFDVNDSLYGEERLLAVAEKGYCLHPRELLEAVRDDVASYAQGAVQSDDITILTLEVGVPPEKTATLEVPAVLEQLDRVNEFLHAELDRRLCPRRVQNQLDIAVEELFVNVCSYAYPNATPETPGFVRIQRTYSADPPSITVDIIDAGIPYNPLSKPDAVTPDNIEDVPIGGLGILMAKKCTDEMRYEWIDGCNITTIVKKW